MLSISSALVFRDTIPMSRARKTTRQSIRKQKKSLGRGQSTF